MGHRGIYRSSAVLALLLVGSGCTLYQPRPVTFTVRDGDTGQPVERAEVKTHYLVMFDFGVIFGSIGPQDGVTDRDGKLTLVVDPDKSSYRMWVTADGYPAGELWGHGSPCWQRRVPGPWYSLWDNYDVQLFRGQQPTACVTLPNDYRGIVLVNFAAESSPPPVPGQRSFSYTASPGGVVTIRETALFQSSRFFGGIRARYQDGFTLRTVVHDSTAETSSDGPSGDVVALRFIWSDGNTWLYVLGTAAEAKTVEQSVWSDQNHFDESAFDKLVAAHQDASTEGSAKR